MSGFLLNMIHRHQGLVDKVQPRVRSIFEPESAPAAAGAAFTNIPDATTANERPDTDVENPSGFTKTRNIELSVPESPPPSVGSIVFKQAPRPYEDNMASDPNPPAGNRIDLMDGQIQSLLARLAGKPEPQESFNGSHPLQKPLPSDAAGQNAISLEAIERGLSGRLEETLRRLTNQADYSKDGQSEIEDHEQPAPAHADKTEADPLTRLPRQTGNKAKEPGEVIYKPARAPAEPINAPKSGQVGTLHPPAWLKDLQTNLNARRRETNTHAQAEPVINVTIGRIEVRAVNAEPLKPFPAHAKPKGVLSLDDYLKQRESKGRT